MEPEQQPMEVHDPSKILNAPQPADDYGAATRASVLAGAIPAEEQDETLEIPPEGSLATEEVDKGPGEAMAETVAGTAEWVKEKVQGVWISVVAGTTAVEHKAAGGLGSAAETVKGKVGGVLGLVKEKAMAGAEDVYGRASRVVKATKQVLAEDAHKAKGAMEEAGDAGSARAEEALEHGKAQAAATAGTAKARAAAAMEKGKELAAEAYEAAKRRTRENMEHDKAQLQQAGAAIKHKAQEVARPIQQAAAQAYEAHKAKGASEGRGTVEGTKGAACTHVAEPMEEAADRVRYGAEVTKQAGKRGLEQGAAAVGAGAGRVAGWAAGVAGGEPGEQQEVEMGAMAPGAKGYAHRVEELVEVGEGMEGTSNKVRVQGGEEEVASLAKEVASLDMT